jgi:hypothetical protein
MDLVVDVVSDGTDAGCMIWKAEKISTKMVTRREGQWDKGQGGWRWS